MRFLIACCLFLFHNLLLSATPLEIVFNLSNENYILSFRIDTTIKYVSYIITHAIIYERTRNQLNSSDDYFADISKTGSVRGHLSSN